MSMCRGALKGQKRVLGRLELELQVVSELPDMGARNSTTPLKEQQVLLTSDPGSSLVIPFFRQILVQLSLVWSLRS